MQNKNGVVKSTERAKIRVSGKFSIRGRTAVARAHMLPIRRFSVSRACNGRRHIVCFRAAFKKRVAVVFGFKNRG